MEKVERQANKLINEYLKITKNLESAKECSLLAVDKIMENCKNTKISYWQYVKKEISEYQSVFLDLRK
jgi:hypothetical protein